MRKEAVRRLVSGVALVLLAGTIQYAGQSQSVIADVRAAIAQQDYARGERILFAYRSVNGVTPEMLVALSWLGRGALAARLWEKAEAYARETYDLALSELEGRTVDQEPHLPIALGAAIEVQAHVTAARGARTEAVGFLRRELETYAPPHSTNGFSMPAEELELVRRLIARRDVGR